eukprot:18679-Heterococcus_DN1.PRE.1
MNPTVANGINFSTHARGATAFERDSTFANLSKRAAKSVGARSLEQKLSSSANAGIAALAQSGRAADLGGESSDAAGDLNSESGGSSEGSVALAPEQQHREDSGEEKETQLYTVGGGDSDDDDDASDGESSDRESSVGHTTALEQSSESFESDEQEVSESDEATLMKRVKALWRARMLAPPSQDKLGELLAEVRNEQKTLLTYGPSDFSGNDLSKKGLQGRNMVYKLLLSELLSDRETIAPTATAAATTTAAASSGAAAGGLGGRWIDSSDYLSRGQCVRTCIWVVQLVDARRITCTEQLASAHGYTDATERHSSVSTVSTVLEAHSALASCQQRSAPCSTDCYAQVAVLVAMLNKQRSERAHRCYLSYEII